MSIVYYVQHAIRYADHRDRKGIGTFSSLANAHRAMLHLKDKPGFSDSRGSFDIYACQVDQNYWPHGLDNSKNSAKTINQPSTESNNTKPIAQVHLLYYENTSIDANDEFILVGYYSAHELAVVAQEGIGNSFNQSELQWQFGVSVSVIDREEWTEGFVGGN